MSKPSGVLGFEDLQQLTGYQRRADVERTLASQGVKIFRGRTGPWTTIDLINRAAGSEPDQAQYGPQIL